MTAVKASDVDAFVARVDPARRVVLVFGPDAGLVSERVEAIVGASVDDPRDALAVTRIPGDELASDPARLADEAQAIPMFGSGRRAVWVRVGARSFLPALEAALALPLHDCRIVIEAGDLKRTAPLRALCERAPNAAALPCYEDDARTIQRLIDEEMRAANLTIAADARAALTPLLGGDRRASRNELRKLALYAHGHGSVTLDDVLEIAGDASGIAIDELVDAAFVGKHREVETRFAKAVEGGTSPGTIVFAALRQSASMHKARMSIDAGSSVDREAEAMRVHFRRKPAIEAALRSWTSAALVGVMEALGRTQFETRRQAVIATTLTHRALMAIAMRARG